MQYDSIKIIYGFHTLPTLNQSFAMVWYYSVPDCGETQQNSEHLISHKEGVKVIVDVDFKEHSKQLAITQLTYIHIFYLIFKIS